MNDYFTIGQVSERFNIPARTLRKYDDNGLFSPAYKNPKTGYRYYTKSQMPFLIFIYYMKSIGIPDTKIKLLSNNRSPDNIQKLVRENAENLRGEINKILDLYDKNQEFLINITNALSLSYAESGNADQNSIKLIDYPGIYVLYQNELNMSADNYGDYALQLAKLNSIAERKSYVVSGTNLAIFHTSPLAQFQHKNSNLGEYEIAISLAEKKNRDLFEKDEMVKKIPAFKAISAVHVGPQMNMQSLYMRCYNWAQEHGYEVESELALEEYWSGSFNCDDPQRYLTRIFIPLKGSNL